MVRNREAGSGRKLLRILKLRTDKPHPGAGKDRQFQESILSFKNSSSPNPGVAYRSDRSALAGDVKTPKQAWDHIKNMKIGSSILMLACMKWKSQSHRRCRLSAPSYPLPYAVDCINVS